MSTVNNCIKKLPLIGFHPISGNCAFAVVRLCLQGSCDCLSDFLHVFGRLEACDHLTFAVNQELREVPLDICFLSELFVVHPGKLVQSRALQSLAKTFKRLFRGKKYKQRISGLAVSGSNGFLRGLARISADSWAACRSASVALKPSVIRNSSAPAYVTS